ncbi:hypothetical protein RFA54_001643 [Vibrio vulnificus]|nr:hypothetical protein [Vibrio vulnificus]
MSIKSAPLSDMEPDESLLDYAVRKQNEAEVHLNRVANLRDWIHQISVNSGNETFIIDATSSALAEDIDLLPEKSNGARNLQHTN